MSPEQEVLDAVARERALYAEIKDNPWSFAAAKIYASGIEAGLAAALREHAPEVYHEIGYHGIRDWTYRIMGEQREQASREAIVALGQIGQQNSDRIREIFMQTFKGPLGG